MTYHYCFTGEAASKKNSKRIVYARGRAILLPSEKYKKWEKVARTEILTKGIPTAPLQAARLTIDIYHGDCIHRDTNNATQGVQDVLVDMGVIADDNWMVIGSPDVRHFIDIENPRMEVTVEEQEPYNWKEYFKEARNVAKRSNKGR